jgi:hypothetical protein
MADSQQALVRGPPATGICGEALGPLRGGTQDAYHLLKGAAHF